MCDNYKEQIKHMLIDDFKMYYHIKEHSSDLYSSEQIKQELISDYNDYVRAYNLYKSQGNQALATKYLSVVCYISQYLKSFFDYDVTEDIIKNEY